jgi:two-component system, chemotaxis family, chemotaxis protein CheY
VRTLIVEDSETSAELLQAMLSPFGKCCVVSNGKEAVAEFEGALGKGKGRGYDLVCLDIMMPEMDGQAALSAIRAMEEAREVRGLDRAKIIMVTAAETRENLLRAFRQECDGYVEKPVVRDELLTYLYSLKLVDSDALVRHLLRIG